MSYTWIRLRFEIPGLALGKKSQSQRIRLNLPEACNEQEIASEARRDFEPPPVANNPSAVPGPVTYPEKRPKTTLTKNLT